MNIQPYDFVNPMRQAADTHLASDMEHILARWLRNACALAPKKWAKQVPFPVEMRFQGLEVVRSAEGLAKLPDSAVGFRVAVPSENKSTLLSLPRPLLLSLVAGMLGETLAELPADRELTIVEDSLCEFLVQDLLLSTLRETWPGQEQMQLGQPLKETHPRWTRIFLPDENIVICSLFCKGPFGEQAWNWLAPQQLLLRLLGLAEPDADLEVSDDQDVKARLQALVREMDVDVTVLLGSVEVPLSLLAKLRVGDAVVLDQRITEPLIGIVSGQEKFLGWPGRVGSQQAFQIESIIDG